MGDLNRSPARVLRDAFNDLRIQCVIETGSWRGESATWFMQYFCGCVISIELDFECFKSCLPLAEYYGHNMLFLWGNSQELLFVASKTGNELATKIKKQELIRRNSKLGDFTIAPPQLFYLDAHWNAGNGQPRPQIECPLLGELAEIARVENEKYILIDDAKYFTTGDPSGMHTPDQWPSLDEIKAALPDDYFTVVHNDFIVSVPQRAREVIESWMEE
jgi:hypothetical protein